MQENEPKKRSFAGLIVIAALAAVLILFAGIYIHSIPSYKADETALAVLEEEKSDDAEVTIRREGKMIIFAPAEPKAGMIFYPETGVEREAYAPLMKACAKSGILCVLEKMPFDLPVFGINAAENTFGLKSQRTETNTLELKSLRTEFPKLKWYMAGHGMGGTIASIYAFAHTDELYGVILLGSYPTKNLSGAGLKLLSIYGSEDKILDFDRYKENHVFFPEKYKEYELSGGNHAFFGSYGEQKGDGSASITGKQQIKSTAALIKKFLIKKKKAESETESETAA